MKRRWLFLAMAVLSSGACGHRSESDQPGERQPGSTPAEQKGGLNTPGVPDNPGRGTVGGSGSQVPPPRGE